MSEMDGYKPFAVVRNAIDKLESQGLLKLIGEKERIIELVTQDLMQAGVLREYIIDTKRPYPTNIHNTLEQFVTQGGKVNFIKKNGSKTPSF